MANHAARRWRSGWRIAAALSRVSPMRRPHVTRRIVFLPRVALERRRRD